MKIPRLLSACLAALMDGRQAISNWLKRTRYRLLEKQDRHRGIKRVHFIHIRKAGGNAVKSALRQDSYDKRTKQVRFGNTRLLLHRHDYTLSDVPDDELAFFFVRDPVSRFISGFYSRKRGGWPRNAKNSSAGPRNERERAIFQRFETPNELALALQSGNDDTRHLAHKAMKGIDHLRFHYSAWLGDENYFLSRMATICLVGRQENLGEDFERLKTALDLPAHLALPADDYGSHRNPEGLNKHLDDQAVGNLEAWYRDDYRFLALCARHAEALNYAGHR